MANVKIFKVYVPLCYQSFLWGSSRSIFWQSGLWCDVVANRPGTIAVFTGALIMVAAYLFIATSTAVWLGLLVFLVLIRRR